MGLFKSMASEYVDAIERTPSKQSESLAALRERNEARFQELKAQMMADGKHMLSQNFKWRRA